MGKSARPLIRRMRIANAVLAPLPILGCVFLVIEDLGKNLGAGDGARIFGQFIGGALGSAPLYLAWRGLGPDSTIHMVRRARLANLVVAGLLVLFTISEIVAFSDKSTSFLQLLPFLLITLIYTAPLALNIKALAQRKAELDQTNTDQAAEHLEAQATPDVAAAMSTTAYSAPPSTGQSSSNYFVRHWRGECSLGISYWLNSNLAGIASLVLIAAVNMMEEGSYSLRAISFASIGVLFVSVTASVWSLVGIWRSANHHVVQGGSSGWASAARVGVAFGTIAMASHLFTTILPQIKEFALIASGNDPIGNIKIYVATNGQSVIVHGMLREGAAVEVLKILDAAPSATSLVLDSAGGRLLEAQQLAHAVRSRHLNTYVEDQCASACTYVFLAGNDRAATPNARIGFHQPSFPGLDADAQRASTQTMLDVYRAAELPEAFIQRIAKTPPEDMWYPTRDELIAAHVITRVSLGGEAAISGLGMRSKQELLLIWGSSPLFQAIEKRFPGTTNEAVERGWAVKERGGTDGDIQNAVRGIIIEIIPTLLKTADVSTLDSFVKLLSSELSAAQAISGDACAQLIAGKLDILNTLPKEIVEQDQQFLLLALASPPTAALTPPDPAQFTQAMQKARVNLPQQYINVVDDMKAYANRPDLVCEAMIAYWGAIAALPSQERHVALRGMLQGEEATSLKPQPQPELEEEKAFTAK